MKSQPKIEETPFHVQYDADDGEYRILDNDGFTIGYCGKNRHAALIVKAVNNFEALNAVAEAAKPFERLKDSRSACSDAYHIATDATGKQSIGQILTKALAKLEAVRKEGK